MSLWRWERRGGNEGWEVEEEGTREVRREEGMRKGGGDTEGGRKGEQEGVRKSDGGRDFFGRGE